MIDLHSHLLPGLDDGPPDSVGSVALADAAAASGVQVMVATPHVRPDHPKVRVHELRERTARLAETVRSHGIPLEVLPGAELSWLALPGLDDDALRAATLGANGCDVLLETPWEPFGNEFEDVTRDLLARGFRVTLAHPERSQVMQQDPERLGRLVEMGVLVQVTASSLSRPRGSGARRLALLAIERGWVHVLASDAHAVEWRPPDLAPTVTFAKRLLPDFADALDWMVTDAPAAITEGRPLPQRPERRAAAPRLADSLRRR